MTPAQFVGLFVKEKRELLSSYLTDSDSAIAAQIKELDLSPKDRRTLKAILDGILTDAFYTVLLALDGAGSLGGKQATYSLRDEKGHELTGGEIEAAAWERFHGDS